MTTRTCDWPNVSDSSFGAIGFNTVAATMLLVGALVTYFSASNPPTNASIGNELYRAAWWLMCWAIMVAQYVAKMRDNLGDCLYIPVMRQFWILIIYVLVYDAGAIYYINDRE